MDALEELVNWRAVHDLSLRYATGIDTRDWALYRSCFSDTLPVDFSSFTHRPAPPGEVDADEWVAMVRSTIEGFESTQHLIGNQIISFGSIEEDDARPDSGGYTAYIQAQHWMSRDRWYLIGGWYENGIRRVDGTWRISAVTLHQTWDAGDRSLLAEAARRMRGRSAG